MKINQTRFILSAVKPQHYPPASQPEVAFAGRSNSGKSSLLNMLLSRKQLARVSKTPGRPQLINFFEITESFHLVDLPGYGYAKVPIKLRRAWGPMIERYVRNRETLRVMAVLMDIRREPSPEDHMLVNGMAQIGLPVVLVVTKCDKLSGSQGFQRRKLIAKAFNVKPSMIVMTSSTKSKGREELWKRLTPFLEPMEEASEVDAAPTEGERHPTEVDAAPTEGEGHPTVGEG